MNDPTRVLYVSPDEATARRLESAFGDRRPDLELAAVASPTAALATLDAEPVDHVVLDAAMADRATAEVVTIRDADADVVGHRVRRQTGESTRALADRIERAVRADSPGDGTELLADGRGIDGEHFRAVAETLSDALLVIDADSVVTFANPAVEEVFGYRPDELVGEPLTTLMPDELAEKHRDRLLRYLETGEPNLDWREVELTGRRKDGTEIPLRISFGEFVSEGEKRFTGVVRDISAQKRREEKLVVLTEMMSLLAETETPRAISQVAVDTAVEVLEFPNVAVALYDDDENALVPTVRRWRTGSVDDFLDRRDDGVAWRTFVENESRVYDDLASSADAEAETASVVAVPLGKHGVFLAGAPEPNAFDSTDASLADVLCSNVRSALDRADREVALRAQRNDLREKNRKLERVNRLNRVIRELTRAVTRASSPADVMQVTCDRLTEAGPYQLAWFGEYDRSTDEVRARASAGDDGRGLSDLATTAGADDSLGDDPVGRAVREREVQVSNDLLGDPPFEPWRKAALERGYRSCVSVPVAHGGALRGVLTVFADEPGAFNQREQTVLSELGEIVGYAMTTLEQKEALVSERSIELDFRIGGTENPILDFVDRTEAAFEFENAVQREDGQLHVYFSVRDVPPEETLARAEAVPWVRDVRLVAERDGESLYECAIDDSSFLRTLVDRGAIPRSITATDGEGRFVVRVPQNADVRTFVNLFEDYYGRAELVARRERDEPVLTSQEFEAKLHERLTDRQAEVVQMAYFGGFFEWPRESTAEEIADALGVSQPTVSRHIRGAERELFGLLFDDENDDSPDPAV